MSETPTTVAARSVYESCQCPAKAGESCPLSEHECALRVRKAIATSYLQRAADLSSCAWKCATKYVSDGFDACCPRCQQIALAMVDAQADGRYLYLTLRAATPAAPVLSVDAFREALENLLALSMRRSLRADEQFNYLVKVYAEARGAHTPSRADEWGSAQAALPRRNEGEK